MNLYYIEDRQDNISYSNYLINTYNGVLSGIIKASLNMNP